MHINGEEYIKLVNWQRRARRLFVALMIAVLFVSASGAVGTLPGDDQNVAAMVVVGILFLLSSIHLLSGKCPRCGCKLFIRRRQGLALPSHCPECKIGFTPQA